MDLLIVAVLSVRLCPLIFWFEGTLNNIRIQSALIHLDRDGVFTSWLRHCTHFWLCVLTCRLALLLLRSSPERV